MDEPSEQAVRILETLTACSEQFIKLAVDLRNKGTVKSTSHSVAFRAYESGPMIEVFVDAELLNGKAVVWGVELSWDRERWKIDHFVRANDAQGQYAVRDFPPFVTPTLEELLPHLKSVTEQLTSLARQDAGAGHAG